MNNENSTLKSDNIFPTMQKDEEIRLSEERSRLLIEYSADDFFLHDDKGIILDVNRQACLNMGYSRDEFLRMQVQEFSVGFTPQELEAIWAKAEPGTSSTVYAEHQRKDGSIFPAEVRISCLISREKKAFYTVSRNITERMEAERTIRQLNAELERRVIERTQQWRRSSELLQAVMDGATDAIFLKDVEGRFLLFNRAAAGFVGFPVEQVLGKTAQDIFGKTMAQQIREHELKVLQSGEPATIEETIVVNGQGRTFLTTRSPYRDEQGNIAGLIGISRDITGMKHAEAALRDSEARWQFALDGAGDGLWDWNTKIEKVFFSPQWKAMLGYAEEEVGDDLSEWLDRVHPEDLPSCMQAVDDHLNRQTSDFILEHRMKTREGSWKWILSRGKTVERAPDGSPLRVIGTHTDITARRTAEDELSVERERLKMAAEASRLGVWDYNLDAGTIICDDLWYEILGIDPAASIGPIEMFNRYIHPDDVNRFIQERTIALAERQKTHRIEFRILTPAGDTRWIISAARLVEASERTPNRLVGIVMDITERCHAEEQLQRSYEALRQAEKLAKIGSWTLNLESSIFSSSDMLNEMNGLGPDDSPLSLDKLQELLPPESFEKIRSGIELCIATGKPYDVGIKHYRTDGTSYAAHVMGQANRDASGNIISLTGTVQDITEREEARARLAALADNLPNGAIYRLEHLDNNQFALTYISAGISSLIGIQATDIIAAQDIFSQAIYAEDLLRYQKTLEHSFSTRKVFDCQFRMKTHSGQLIWMHSRSAPRYQTDGTTVWDGIMRDITIERQAAEALQRAKESAEAAEHAKSEFLATMSHEIRTPMNTVIGMTRLTLQTNLLPKQRNYLEKIDSSAKTLLSIINDVLDFSKIEAGKLELEDAEFQLESVLESVSNVTAMRAEEKGLEIVYAVDPHVPRNLRGDPLRLGQVLINLISNAVKFTHIGEIVVSVGATKKNNDSVMLQFSVRDTGIGLDSAQIEGLFRAFTQADSDVSRKYGGTGLGLAICKQLVEMMGGNIWVESEPGKGSIFFFTIKSTLSGETDAISTTARNQQSLANRRVLIVDDNDTARQILFSMVKDFGMTPIPVDSGAAALKTLKSASHEGHPFDLVLMDWRMPGMDGIETARRIRNEKALDQMPAVLMVTAYGRDEILRSAEKLGLQGVLIKPITESVMFNTIMDILGLNHSNNIRLESPSDAPISFGSSYKPEELSMLVDRHVLVVDDNALNREVVSDFLFAVGMEVEIAVDGIDALQQLESKTYDVVLMDMHMPELDGLEATKIIRQNPHWSDLPIVALTAQARIEDRNASLAAGMTAHLTKPIDEAILYKTLIDVLHGTTEAKNSDEVAITVIGASGGTRDVISSRPDGPDILAALRRLGGNEERLQRLLHGFLRDNATTSRQLDHYLQKGDMTELAAIVHTVKGSASYFEAHELCGLAERLEVASRHGEVDKVKQYAPIFHQLLESLLRYLRDHIAGLPVHPAVVIQPDLGSILPLIEQAEPLIANGDYAAQSLLEQICSRLEGGEDTVFAEEARMHYEELELQSALDALHKLKIALRSKQ